MVITIGEGVGGGDQRVHLWPSWLSKMKAVLTSRNVCNCTPTYTASRPTRSESPRTTPWESGEDRRCLFVITVSVRGRISSSVWFMGFMLIIFTFERTFFRKGLSFAVGGHWILEVDSVFKSPGGVVVDTKCLGSCDVAKSIVFELDYNVMEWLEYFLTL